MKQLFLNPSIFLILLLLTVISLMIILNSKLDQKLRGLLETPGVIFVFLNMFSLIFPPFSFSDPQRFTLYNLSLTGLAISTSVCCLPFLILRNTCFKNFNPIENVLLTLRRPDFTALLLLIMLSSFWSETPLLTLRSGLVPIGMTVLAIQISHRYTWQQLDMFLRWTLALVAICSTFVALFLPSLRPFGDPWGGVLANAKLLGALMAFNAVLWLMQVIQQRQLVTPSSWIVVFSLILLIVSNAKGALVGGVILLYVAVVLLLLNRLKFKQSVAVAVFSALFSIVLVLSIETGVDYLFQLLGKDPTLTGRTNIWEQIVDDIKNHPLGHGYNGFWQSWRGNDDPALSIQFGSIDVYQGNRPYHAHNGFLDVGLQLGYIGLILFLICFLITAARAIWLAQFSNGYEAVFPLLILTYLVVANLSESERLGLIGPNHSWFLYSLVVSKLDFAIRSRSNHQKILISSAT